MVIQAKPDLPGYILFVQLTNVKMMLNCIGNIFHQDYLVRNQLKIIVLKLKSTVLPKLEGEKKCFQILNFCWKKNKYLFFS